MKNLLVISSAYPRWNNDVYANFVRDLLNNLNRFNITVLSPHYYGIKKQICQQIKREPTDIEMVEEM